MSGMRAFGIFLGYPPDLPIRKEGSGRLLAFILRGALVAQDVQVWIAAPYWYRKEIADLLDDHDIDRRKIRFLFTNGIPYSLRLRKLFEALRLRRRRSIGWASRLYEKAAGYLWKFAVGAGSSSTVVEIFPYVILFLIAIPLLIPIGLIVGFVAIWRRIWGVTIQRLFPSVSKLGMLFSSPLISFRSVAWARETYQHIQGREFDRLISAINKHPDIPVWFVPSLLWPETAGIDASIVVAAPDIVFLEFPAQFASLVAEQAFRKIVKTTASADKLICYSDYVKQHHLIGALGVAPDKIELIRHGRTDMRSYLKTADGGNDSIAIRRSAIQTLKNYQREHLYNDGFWKNAEFDRLRYIFYSSQLRPHKNILNLVKSVREINFEHGQDLKLVITADISAFPPIADVIRNEGLDSLVLSIHDVPSKVIAALNALAVLAVNPSLFEGGFPFTFCEAYSVGTPSIMGNIPAVGELVTDPELRSRMLFDPYLVEDMSQKILWGLDHRGELRTMQAGLFESFASWDRVALNYVDSILGAAKGEGSV